MVREKRITIRLSENEYVKLQEEASKKELTISDYLRNNLFNERKINELQSPYYKQQMNLQDLKMELLDLRYFIERLTNVKRSNKEYIEERIENIWHMLK